MKAQSDLADATRQRVVGGTEAQVLDERADLFAGVLRQRGLPGHGRHAAL